MLYLFDIDGTLLLTGGAGSRALNEVFEEAHGVGGAMNGVSAGGKTDPLIISEMFENALGRLGSPTEVASILGAYEERLPAALLDSPGFHTLPHVETVLDVLEADSSVTLAIATGNSEPGARAKLEHAKLADRFVCGGYGCDSANRGELVAAAISRAQAIAERPWRRDQIVVVGDTPRDVSAARENGIRVAAVATGRPTRGELEACRPDVVLDTLAELLPWHRAQA